MDAAPGFSSYCDTGLKMKRRELVFSVLNESCDEVERLQTIGYRSVAQWDLGSICQHLTKTIRMSLEGASFSLPFFIQPFARMMIFKKVMRCAPVNLKARSPKKLAPATGLDVEQEFARYQVAVGEVLSDKSVLIPKHPVFGRVTKDQWLRFHIWHAAHHLSFLLPNESKGSRSAAS